MQFFSNGYLRRWSALRKYVAKTMRGALGALRSEFRARGFRRRFQSSPLPDAHGLCSLALTSSVNEGTHRSCVRVFRAAFGWGIFPPSPPSPPNIILILRKWLKPRAMLLKPRAIWLKPEAIWPKPQAFSTEKQAKAEGAAARLVFHRKTRPCLPILACF